MCSWTLLTFHVVVLCGLHRHGGRDVIVIQWEFRLTVRGAGIHVDKVHSVSNSACPATRPRGKYSILASSLHIFSIKILSYAVEVHEVIIYGHGT